MPRQLRWQARCRSAGAWHVIAAGKAAVPMLRACLDGVGTAHPPQQAMVAAPGGLTTVPADVERFVAGHPTPTIGSTAAGRRALAIARQAAPDDELIVLLSGGASALLACPVHGVTLDDKCATTARLLREGADIHALNTVRKHLSQIKGGRLAAVCPGRVLCLAISDVVDDDPSVIGSGPTVGDATTYADALAVLDRFGGQESYPAGIRAWLAAGVRGEHPETPKPGALEPPRVVTRLVGTRTDALLAARREAELRGYRVVVVEAPVTGEARVAAATYAAQLTALARETGPRLCVLSGGETTVRVAGTGMGGRNQEFALALVEPLARMAGPVLVASVGTDGIDGPTDAAGALVDTTTASRAVSAGLESPQGYLDNNDAYRFFDAMGDLIRTGPTATNVGDIQVGLIATGREE
ncbi:MAG: DUF4147 domain-containing protein [Acidobacteria bacterium]|nr:DUF4147 domain-containing protein [Acidobacteriota bacterium]